MSQFDDEDYLDEPEDDFETEDDLAFLDPDEEEARREELIAALVEEGYDRADLEEEDTQELERMYDDMNDESLMYPNGRDYDAEDFD